MLVRADYTVPTPYFEVSVQSPHIEYGYASFSVSADRSLARGVGKAEAVFVARL